MSLDITRLIDPDVFDHPVSKIKLIETHISWVVLTGDYAYKIKKPVDFGFLNFSTLEKRHKYCQLELLLNRRLASEIYLDVVSITESCDGLAIVSVADQGHEIIEYAVKMRQFSQTSLLDYMLSAGELDSERVSKIAAMVADFHLTTSVADKTMVFGDNDHLIKPVIENFTQIEQHLGSNIYAGDLADLKRWSKAQFDKLKSTFIQRKAKGFIRECHGDMHLGNLIWLDEKPMAFDCIEFNEELRWIDVISEVAFLIMDLQNRKHHKLANRFLNTYLEITGDYTGLKVLSFYLCYRAMVRAKVDVLSIEHTGASEKKRKLAISEFESYIELANTFARQSIPKLIIMRGLSASGKSTIAKQLSEELSAICIRSDVERKRLFDIDTGVSATSDIDAGIYSADASKQTYEKLQFLAEQIISAGYSVIVDATFLDHTQRVPFQMLAEHLEVPYIILEVTASAEELRRRIIERKDDVSDANLTVLNHQLSHKQALNDNETDNVINIDTEMDLDIQWLKEVIEQR